MSLYAVIKGNLVDGIAIADSPLETDGKWICIDAIEPKPQAYWVYENGIFSKPVPAEDVNPPPSPKTEEEKLADAASAVVTKLIANGVLKQA